MKLTIRHHQIRSTDPLDQWVEELLLPLESRLLIEEAVVILSRNHTTSPAFRARIKVVTPGPDLEVEGKDHTIQAALSKAVSTLDAKLDRRDRNRAWCSRTNRRNADHHRRGPGRRTSF